MNKHYPDTEKETTLTRKELVGEMEQTGVNQKAKVFIFLPKALKAGVYNLNELQVCEDEDTGKLDKSMLFLVPDYGQNVKK